MSIHFCATSPRFISACQHDCVRLGLFALKVKKCVCVCVCVRACMRVCLNICIYIYIYTHIYIYIYIYMYVRTCLVGSCQKDYSHFEAPAWYSSETAMKTRGFASAIYCYAKWH